MTINNLTNVRTKKYNKQKKTFLILLIMLFVLTSISLFISAHTFYHQNKLKKLLTSQNEYSDQLKELKNQITEQNNKIQGFTQFTDKINLKLALLEKNFQQNNYKENTWFLLKARYYLELANITLQTSDDISTILYLSKEVDHLLLESKLPDVIPIREQLAKENLQIKSFPQIDLLGLLSKIQSIQNALNQLPLKPVNIVKNNDAKKDNNKWEFGLKESLQKLKKLVIVTYHEQSLNLLPSQYYESILKEKVALNLEQMQLALLRNNDQFFHFSLLQAINNIEKLFDTHQSATVGVITELNSLKDTNINPINLNFNTSLNLLNKVIDKYTSPNTGENN